MLKIYTKLIYFVVIPFYWWLDYIYVFLWQLKALVTRDSPSNYLNPDSNSLPVIVLPGIYEKWYFMKPIIDVLYKNNFSIHIIDSLGYNAGTVEEIAIQVQKYIRVNNLGSCIIVAHSKGGLIAKYLLGISEDKIEKVVAISTPFKGSVYAHLLPLKTLRIFIPSSKILNFLSKDLRSNSKITSIYGYFDPHIPGGSYLENAHNIQVSTKGHFRILNDKKVHKLIISQIT